MILVRTVVLMLRVTAGHDIEYPLRSAGSAADYYLQDGKEPPRAWAGKAGGDLGLSGLVDPEVYRNLFGKLIAPTGERLYSGRPPRYATGTDTNKDAEADAAVAALDEFATPAEKRRTRAKVLGSTGAAVPFYDLTFSATKSVSVLQASYAATAAAARARGDTETADMYEARVKAIDDAAIGGRPAGYRPGRGTCPVRPDRPPQRAYRRVAGRGRGAVRPARQPQRRAEPARAHGAAQPGGARRRAGVGGLEVAGAVREGAVG